jgi:hypothetical protein
MHKSKTRYQSNFKDVPCSGLQSGSIIGVFLSEEEFCAPIFSEIESGSQIVFTSKVISVPILNEEDKLMFTIQIETETDFGQKKILVQNILN